MADQLDIFLVVQNGHILILKAEEIGGRACRFDVLSSRPPSWTGFHNFERTALARLYLVRRISSSNRAKWQGVCWPILTKVGGRKFLNLHWRMRCQMMMWYLRSVLSVLLKDVYFLAQYISLSFFLSDSSLACFDERSPRDTDAFRFSRFLIFNIFLFSSLCVSLSIFF